MTTADLNESGTAPRLREALTIEVTLGRRRSSSCLIIEVGIGSWEQVGLGVFKMICVMSLSLARVNASQWQVAGTKAWFFSVDGITGKLSLIFWILHIKNKEKSSANCWEHLWSGNIDVFLLWRMSLMMRNRFLESFPQSKILLLK